MKTSLKIIFATITLLYYSSLYSQFGNYHIMDINNYHVGLYQGGNIGYTSLDEGVSIAPAGGYISPLLSGNMWLIGIGNDIEYKGFMPTYNRDPVSPGPAAHDLLFPNQQWRFDSLYRGVWQITKAEIEYHKQNWNLPGYAVPQSLLDWPANGDSIVQTSEQLAPFADSNNNGVYEPHFGEYPVIKGDKCLLTYFNDYKSTIIDSESNPSKSGCEIQMMMYAYYGSDYSVLGNTVFLNYRIIPKSDILVIDTAFIGMFMEFEIGNYINDFRGSDSVLNLMYAYNGELTDGLDSTYGYQNMLPAFGITSLSHDLFSAMLILKDFGFYDMPYNIKEAYKFLQAYFKDGSHLQYGGVGIGVGNNTNFVMGDRPDDPYGWSDVSMGNVGNDIKGVAGIGPFSLQKGDTLCFEAAMVFANDLDYVDDVSSVILLYSMVNTLQTVADLQVGDFCMRSFQDSTIAKPVVSGIDEFIIFPNPASDNVNIHTGSMSDNFLEIEMYDIIARKVYSAEIFIPYPDFTFNIPITQFATGVYSMVFTYDSYRFSDLLMVH